MLNNVFKLRPLNAMFRSTIDYQIAYWEQQNEMVFQTVFL